MWSCYFIIHNLVQPLFLYTRWNLFITFFYQLQSIFLPETSKNWACFVISLTESRFYWNQEHKAHSWTWGSYLLSWPTHYHAILHSASFRGGFVFHKLNNSITLVSDMLWSCRIKESICWLTSCPRCNKSIKLFFFIFCDIDLLLSRLPMVVLLILQMFPVLFPIMTKFTTIITVTFFADLPEAEGLRWLLLVPSCFCFPLLLIFAAKVVGTLGCFISASESLFSSGPPAISDYTASQMWCKLFLKWHSGLQ